MDEETEQTKTGYYHLSVGSATNGIHISTDVAMDDPNLYQIIDNLIDLSIKGKIAVKNKDPYTK